jgi:hypothetical protein
MLVATGTMTIELTVANATQVCVARNPDGAIAVNATLENYYSSQQQYLGYTAQNNDAAVAESALRAYNGATSNSMIGWTEANYTALSLSVSITNAAFVANKIIVPDTICTAVTSRAASSDISVMTSSARAYATDIDSATGNATHSILVPLSIKVASASALYHEDDCAMATHCRNQPSIPEPRALLLFHVLGGVCLGCV